MGCCLVALLLALPISTGLSSEFSYEGNAMIIYPSFPAFGFEPAGVIQVNIKVAPSSKTVHFVLFSEQDLRLFEDSSSACVTGSVLRQEFSQQLNHQYALPLRVPTSSSRMVVALLNCQEALVSVSGEVSFSQADGSEISSEEQSLLTLHLLLLLLCLAPLVCFFLWIRRTKAPLTALMRLFLSVFALKALYFAVSCLFYSVYAIAGYKLAPVQWLAVLLLSLSNAAVVVFFFLLTLGWSISTTRVSSYHRKIVILLALVACFSTYASLDIIENPDSHTAVLIVQGVLFGVLFLCFYVELSYRVSSYRLKLLDSSFEDGRVFIMPKLRVYATVRPAILTLLLYPAAALFSCVGLTDWSNRLFLFTLLHNFGFLPILIFLGSLVFSQSSSFFHYFSGSSQTKNDKSTASLWDLIYPLHHTPHLDPSQSAHHQRLLARTNSSVALPNASGSDEDDEAGPIPDASSPPSAVIPIQHDELDEEDNDTLGSDEVMMIARGPSSGPFQRAERETIELDSD
ncbi:MAG: hypothetical protein Q8P67_27220 [archaeon]|nr:hypothetical protein [archaeon]